MITNVGVTVMLVALGVYVLVAAVFYALMVRAAQREPEALELAEASYYPRVQPESETATKAA